MDSNDNSLYQEVKEQYPASFICAGKINQHIEKNYQHQLTNVPDQFILSRCAARINAYSSRYTMLPPAVCIPTARNDHSVQCESMRMVSTSQSQNDK
ncbi:PRD domain-containing protein [Serratia symbiotica]|nr:PRD domain-containing protein [Serratia symbiotica]